VRFICPVPPTQFLCYAFVGLKDVPICTFAVLSLNTFPKPAVQCPTKFNLITTITYGLFQPRRFWGLIQ
jgi:hypothetical protein